MLRKKNGKIMVTTCFKNIGTCLIFKRPFEGIHRSIEFSLNIHNIICNNP